MNEEVTLPLLDITSRYYTRRDVRLYTSRTSPTSRQRKKEEATGVMSTLETKPTRSSSAESHVHGRVSSKATDSASHGAFARDLAASRYWRRGDLSSIDCTIVALLVIQRNMTTSDTTRQNKTWKLEPGFDRTDRVHKLVDVEQVLGGRLTTFTYEILHVYPLVYVVLLP